MVDHRGYERAIAELEARVAELEERERNDGWYYNRWRHQKKRTAAANDRAVRLQRMLAYIENMFPQEYDEAERATLKEPAK